MLVGGKGRGEQGKGKGLKHKRAGLKRKPTSVTQVGGGCGRSKPFINLAHLSTQSWDL